MYAWPYPISPSADLKQELAARPLPLPPLPPLPPPPLPPRLRTPGVPPPLSLASSTPRDARYHPSPTAPSEGVTTPGLGMGRMGSARSRESRKEKAKRKLLPLDPTTGPTPTHPTAKESPYTARSYGTVYGYEGAQGARFVARWEGRSHPASERDQGPSRISWLRNDGK